MLIIPVAPSHLSVAHEALDVDESDGVVRIHAIPAAHPGSDPGLHSHIAKRLDESHVRGIGSVLHGTAISSFGMVLTSSGELSATSPQKRNFFPLGSQRVRNLLRKSR